MASIQLYKINKEVREARKGDIKQINLNEHYTFDFESVYEDETVRKRGIIRQIIHHGVNYYFFYDATTGKRHRIKQTTTGELDNLYLEPDMRTGDETDSRSKYKFIQIDAGEEKTRQGGKRKRKRKSKKRKSKKRKSIKRKRKRKSKKRKRKRKRKRKSRKRKRS